jgi:hypothetical protein
MLQQRLPMGNCTNIVGAEARGSSRGDRAPGLVSDSGWHVQLWAVSLNTPPQSDGERHCTRRSPPGVWNVGGATQRLERNRSKVTVRRPFVITSANCLLVGTCRTQSSPSGTRSRTKCISSSMCFVCL